LLQLAAVAVSGVGDLLAVIRSRRDAVSDADTNWPWLVRPAGYGIDVAVVDVGLVVGGVVGNGPLKLAPLRPSRSHGARSP
jgi:hypothetical protein